MELGSHDISLHYLYVNAVGIELDEKGQRPPVQVNSCLARKILLFVCQVFDAFSVRGVLSGADCPHGCGYLLLRRYQDLAQKGKPYIDIEYTISSHLGIKESQTAIC